MLATEHFYFPPFHPNCRCTVVAVRDLNAYTRQEYGDGDDDLPAHSLEDLDISRTVGNYGVAQDGQLVQGPPVTESPTNFLGFDSEDAARSYYASRLPALELELAGVEESTALEVLNQFERLRLEYPEIGRWLERISFEEGTAEAGTLNALSWAYDDGSRLVFNTRYFGNRDKLREVVERNIAEGVFVRANAAPVAHAVTHEVGHLLYTSLSVEQKAVLAAIFESGAGGRLSLVARQDVHEMFAEAFTARHLGRTVTEETAAIQKILESKKPVSTTIPQIRGTHSLPEDVARDFSSYRAFESNREAATFGKENYTDWANNLTDIQRNTVVLYKEKINTLLNNHLRGIPFESVLWTEKKLLEQKAILDTCFTKEIPEDIVVWRGVPDRTVFDELIGGKPWQSAVGDVLTIDKGYMSTSLVEGKIYTFMEFGKEGVRYKIYLPKGSKAGVFLDTVASEYDNEREILLKSGLKFKVLAADETAHLVTLVPVDE